MSVKYTAKRPSRLKHKGRREGGTFVAMPHAVIASDNWRQCSATAIKVLIALARQYNGNNNGDLSAAMKIMKPLGWKSSDTVTLALRELRHYGLIVLTRQGEMKKPNLYALTWLSIDECGGKLETPATRIAPGTWKTPQPRFKRAKKKQKAVPPTGADMHRQAE